MRKLKFILSIITVVIIVFTSLSQLNSQNNPNMKKGFYLGPMSHYFLNVLETGSHNQWYQDLSYNMMHSYCAHLDTIDSNYQNNGQRDGGFFEDTSNYLSEMKSVIAKWNNISHDNSLIFEREKILRPAYGQRFTYQAEDPGTWHLKFPSFGYSSTNVTGENVDDTISGVTIRVRYCKAGRDSAGFMVKGLYENCSQTNNLTRKPDSTNSSGWERLYSDIKQSEYKMRWFIKPRMRIDSTYAKAHMNDTVVIVYVKNFNGDIFDTTIIQCKNFLLYPTPQNPQYDGRYLERYFNSNLPILDTANFLSVLADSLAVGKRGSPDKPDSLSQVDYQIKWLGKVDVWLDYVRVDDSWAHYLFTDTWENEPNNQANIWKFHRRIKQEVDAFANKPGLGYFWVDEVQYPNIECIGEVNKLIKRYSNNQMSLLFITDPKAFIDWTALRNKDIANERQWDSCINKAIRDSALTDIMITQWFPFFYTLKYPDIFPNIPSTYHISQYVFPASNYCTYTSDNEFSVQNSISWFVRQQKYFYKKARDKGLIYGVINQINSDENSITGSGLSGDWGIREPTNEEISLLMHTSMAYGAKIMLEFSYTSKLQDAGKQAYNWGLTTSDNNFTGKRETNYYGQHKWDFVADLNYKLKRTGDYMYPMNLPNEHLIHDITLTVNTVTYPDSTECGYTNYDYVNDIKSLAPYLNGASVLCNQTEGGDYDNLSKRFWELGFFKANPASSKPFDKSKYLYAVNKRTYPVNDTNVFGDIRVLKIKFNSTQLPGFNNWVIKEAVADSVISYFNKSNTEFVNAGEFQPGEGKLLKIVPVMTEGGTLVCDEYINTNFTCNGMVYGNGHNITINQGKTISFNEDGGIFMEGGCFVSGINSDNADAVTLQSTGVANHWKGITLSGCDSVGIYNTITSNAESNDTPKTYSYSIINSYKVDFRKCNFITENDRGIIEAVYNSSSEVPAILKIRESNFFMENCGYPAINVLSNGSSSIPLIAEWCTFHSKDNDTSCAVMLTGVAGGAVKNCYFYDFGKTMIFISSAVDLYGNLILGGNNSKGIECLAGSDVSMGPNSGLYLGGYNYIRNYGTSTSNIYTDNSFFNIDCGNNEFDFDETEYSKHLTGTMSSDDEPAYVDAYKNCFHEDSITNIEAIHDVIWSGSNSNVNFMFEPYFCDLTPPQDFVVFDVYGFPDTVYYKSGGEGGGFNPKKTLNIEENLYKSLKDTVNINLRKRNYTIVETSSKLILTQYPDSLESIGMVQKLYMASLNLDSIKIGLTKTFLENLISNNTQNPSLIKRAFYFIQKCKVKLGQYQSALEGFQYIMTQNPYTYEGLVASWDYAATFLLMGTGGSIQGDNEQTGEDFNLPADTLLNRMSKRDINSTKNTNTNKSTNTNLNTSEETTKIFYEKIKNTTKDDRSKQEEKVKTLEKTLESSKSTTEKIEAARELAVMKQIKEAVKIKKPNTVMNHIQIMNDDIKKVFGVGKKSTKESTNNLIPQTYQLYQNYPNPFNPTTKIAFDIPKDAKVNLVIYDILGREMKTLVNNEFRSAGKYITEFNGSNMASGIYFARIMVNEGKDFIAVKKMVLIK